MVYKSFKKYYYVQSLNNIVPEDELTENMLTAWEIGHFSTSSYIRDIYRELRYREETKQITKVMKLAKQSIKDNYPKIFI